MNEKNIRRVTAESVRAGHPDKFCDQAADAILDAHLRQDSNARVAVEVFAAAGKMIIGGEVTSKAKVSYDRIVAGVINRIGCAMEYLCENPHDLLCFYRAWNHCRLDRVIRLSPLYAGFDIVGLLQRPLQQRSIHFQLTQTIHSRIDQGHQQYAKAYRHWRSFLHFQALPNSCGQYLPSR